MNEVLKLRKSLGLCRKDFSEAVGQSEDVIFNIETGRTQINKNHLSCFWLLLDHWLSRKHHQQITTLMRFSEKHPFMVLPGIQSQWIRVEDAMPDDDIEVLVYTESGVVWLASHDSDCGWIEAAMHLPRIINVTHWMDVIPPASSLKPQASKD
jgi:hypothetical protein